MAKVVKKTKVKSSLTTREKMIQRKEELKKKANAGNMVFIKEGVTRLRVKSPGDDKELGIELLQFFIPDQGSIISPATFDEPCPLMEMYKKLKDSSNESDKELAGKLIPKRRYIIGGIGYKDEKGKEIDPDRIDKPFVITRTLYQDLIDLYLDEDDWGDMTHPKTGYDIKITREGTGQNDTTYSMSPCQRKTLDKKYQGTLDLEEVIKAQIKTYDELEEVLQKYLSNISDDEDENEDDEVKPKKKKGTKKVLKKKKKKSSDI